MEMYGEETAANEVGLRRLAQPQRDVRFAHPQVKLVVVKQHLQLDFGIELQELAKTRRQPIGAEAERRRHAQVAMRLVAAVDQPAARRFELQDDILHCAKKQLALLGQNEAARMAVKKRRSE